jgi:hypothetical protein
MDAARYPRLAGYLAQLPQGLDSYPDCQTKGAVFHPFFSDKRLPDDPALPPQILAIGKGALPQSRWLSSVPLWAGLLAISDHEAMSEAQFVAWARDLNGQLLSGAVYRFLVPMFSPASIVTLSATVFRSFHRGVGLKAVKTADGSRFTINLDFPAGLFTELLVRGIVTSFEVATDLGGHQPKLRSNLASFSSTAAQVEMRPSPG